MFIAAFVVTVELTIAFGCSVVKEISSLKANSINLGKGFKHDSIYDRGLV